MSTTRAPEPEGEAGSPASHVAATVAVDPLAGAGRQCLNCGTAAPGNYCPSCGQATADVRVSLRRMVGEAVDDLFAVNARLPRTLGLLLRRPGRLTTEYLAGRRARFIAPLRLYLVTSFIYFLAFGLSTGGAMFQVEPGTQGQAQLTEEDLRSVREIPFLPEAMAERLSQRLQQVNAAGPDAVNRMLARELPSRIPLAVFLLVPLFAALLKLVYVRRGRYYAEHFVFALHLHAFAFVLFTLVLLSPTRWLSLALLMGFFVYLVQAMRHVYGQPLPRTLVKLAILGAGYGLALAATTIGLLLFILATAPL